MRQVLFHIPLRSLSDDLPNIPIYGYGSMLFLAFLFCTWLASRRAERERINRAHLQDAAIWIFVVGIIGARVTFMIQYHEQYDEPNPLLAPFRLVTLLFSRFPVQGLLLSGNGSFHRCKLGTQHLLARHHERPGGDYQAEGQRKTSQGHYQNRRLLALDEP